MKIHIGTFRAFKSRNYRLYFTGQSISLIGTWMQRTAVSWVIYTMTHSPLMLGVTVFAGQFPSFLLSLLGGVVSDRYNRYKVLLTTQALSLLQAVALAVLVLTKQHTVWEILSLSVFLGIINAFDVPARQALVYEMVDNKDDLSNAIALNSTMVNLARLIGPAVAGIVLEKFGEGVCFIINAASFVAVIFSLLLMRLAKYVPNPHKKEMLGDLEEGMKYLKATPSIALIILMLGLMSLLVLPFNTLLPVYAKVIFKGSASTYGYINSFIGLGSVAGAIFLASLKPGADMKKILFINSLVLGAGLVLFSHISIFPLAMVFATVSGFGMMSQTTVSNTIIQTTVSKEMRGRVISYFAMAYFGMMPLGSLLIGAVSNKIGSPDTLLFEGIAAFLIAIIFLPYLRGSSWRKKKNIVVIEVLEEEALSREHEMPLVENLNIVTNEKE